MLFIGDAESLSLVRELMGVLDVQPSNIGRLQLRIYEPYYVSAKEVMDILNELGITESRSGDSQYGPSEYPSD